MTYYVNSMDIAEMFETIEAAKDQKEAIFAYLNNNMGLRRFLKWYNSYENKEVTDKLEYSNLETIRHDVKLISLLSDLESLPKYPNEKQKLILERMLDKLNNRHVMLLENCLTNDLRVYYPGINWDIFEELGVAVK